MLILYPADESSHHKMVIDDGIYGCPSHKSRPSKRQLIVSALAEYRTLSVRSGLNYYSLMHVIEETTKTLRQEEQVNELRQSVPTKR